MKSRAAGILIVAILAGCSRPASGVLPSSMDPQELPSNSSNQPAASVLIDGSKGAGGIVSHDLLGANLATWYDITQAFVEPTMASTGIKLARWPGGSESDTYHWENGGSVCSGGGYVTANSTFDNFMTKVVIPGHMHAAVTVNYGSNPACNAGGDPNEAASWVAYAKSHSYPVKYWTVGNEVFGSWEYDLHNPAHDPTTYANAVATGYYPLMKAADANAKVGVVVENASAWDATVLTKARYDFVEFHYYAQAPGGESDAYLLGQGITDFANSLRSMRAEMTADGVSKSIPIYVGEINSVYSTPGKQSVSITNGLFAGMVVAEMMKAGLSAATWWLAYGDCVSNGNMSQTLYGWQTFGTYTLFSDGLPEGSCGESIPAGTSFPPARAYQLLADFITTGSAMRNATVGAGVADVRAYADTYGSGYSVLLFNTSKTASKQLTVTITNTSRTSFSGTRLTYGKVQYDRSKNNVWAGPVTTSLGSLGTTFSVTLAPWSMNVIQLR